MFHIQAATSLFLKEIDNKNNKISSLSMIMISIQSGQITDIVSKTKDVNTRAIKGSQNSESDTNKFEY